MSVVKITTSPPGSRSSVRQGFVFSAAHNLVLPQRAPRVPAARVARVAEVQHVGAVKAWHPPRVTRVRAQHTFGAVTPHSRPRGVNKHVADLVALPMTVN